MEKIVLLHDYFVSEVLIEALKNNHMSVFAEGDLKEKLKQRGVYVLSDEDMQQKLSSKNTMIYFNSEDCISIIEKNSKNEELKNNIQFFKDKYAFKKVIEENYPEYFIKEIKKEDLDSFKVPEGKDLIVKPSIGFHSIGIRRFSTQSEWGEIKDGIVKEVEEYSNVFDKKVVSDEKFIVEEYIEGEEFACDAYFNSKGKPVILSISHHPFANTEDTRDLVYYTSAEVMKKMYAPIIEFLELVSSKRKFKNFPIHFEIRVKNEKVYPIEVNPLRFGGFGLSDLPYYAFGINSYDYFFNGKEPKWMKIISKSKNYNYAFIVAQTPENFNSKTESINEEGFKKTFEEILSYTPIDAGKYKFFSTTFTRSRNLEELTKYLHMDFNQYRMVN